MNDRSFSTSSEPVNQLLWVKKLARYIVHRLSDTDITPNQITCLSFILVILYGALFSTGKHLDACIGALLFMIVRFFDHLDGELARMKHSQTAIGHYLDWFVDTFSYAVLFISLFIGFKAQMGVLGYILTITAVIACLLNTLIGLYYERQADSDKNAGFPAFAGFAIDDGIYLIGPITWAGYLYPFFLLCTTGAVIYFIYNFYRLGIDHSFNFLRH